MLRKRKSSVGMCSKIVLPKVVRKKVPLDSLSTNPQIVSLIIFLRTSGTVEPKSFESLARLHFASAILNRMAIRWELPNSKKVLAVFSKGEVLLLFSVNEIEWLLSDTRVYSVMEPYRVSCNIRDRIFSSTHPYQLQYCVLPILTWIVSNNI